MVKRSEVNSRTPSRRKSLLPPVKKPKRSKFVEGLLKLHELDDHLKAKDAALIKGMLDRGERQRDVAALFVISVKTVRDIKSGKRFAEVAPAHHSDLPCTGPYLLPEDIERIHAVIVEAYEKLLGAESMLYNSWWRYRY